MSDDEEIYECPLCLEELDETDRSFVPCPCGYQVCLLCFNHILKELNAKCPACRTPYDQENYQSREIQFQTKKKKRDKSGGGGGSSGGGDKNKTPQQQLHLQRSIAPNKRELNNVRVIQRNLVYMIGIPPALAREEMLRKKEFFGQYGKILKVVANRNQQYNTQGSVGPSYCAYVTYNKREEAQAAIHAVDGLIVEGRILRASFGTTKYCSYFLRNVQCANPDCMYLHELGHDDDSFTKEEMLSSKHQFHEYHVPAQHRGQRVATLAQGFPPPPKDVNGKGGHILRMHSAPEPLERRPPIHFGSERSDDFDGEEEPVSQQPGSGNGGTRPAGSTGPLSFASVASSPPLGPQGPSPQLGAVSSWKGEPSAMRRGTSYDSSPELRPMSDLSLADDNALDPWSGPPVLPSAITANSASSKLIPSAASSVAPSSKLSSKDLPLPFSSQKSGGAPPAAPAPVPMSSEEYYHDMQLRQEADFERQKAQSASHEHSVPPGFGPMSNQSRQFGVQFVSGTMGGGSGDSGMFGSGWQGVGGRGGGGLQAMGPSNLFSGGGSSGFSGGGGDWRDMTPGSGSGLDRGLSGRGGLNNFSLGAIPGLPKFAPIEDFNPAAFSLDLSSFGGAPPLAPVSQPQQQPPQQPPAPAPAEASPASKGSRSRFQFAQPEAASTAQMSGNGGGAGGLGLSSTGMGVGGLSSGVGRPLPAGWNPQQQQHLPNFGSQYAPAYSQDNFRALFPHVNISFASGEEAGLAQFGVSGLGNNLGGGVGMTNSSAIGDGSFGRSNVQSVGGGTGGFFDPAIVGAAGMLNQQHQQIQRQGLGQPPSSFHGSSQIGGQILSGANGVVDFSNAQKMMQQFRPPPSSNQMFGLGGGGLGGSGNSSVLSPNLAHLAALLGGGSGMERNGTNTFPQNMVGIPPMPDVMRQQQQHNPISSAPQHHVPQFPPNSSFPFLGESSNGGLMFKMMQMEQPVGTGSMLSGPMMGGRHGGGVISAEGDHRDPPPDEDESPATDLSQTKTARKKEKRGRQKTAAS